VNDDYLWDRSGPPDEEIAALERVLSPLAQPQPPAPLTLAAWGASPAERRGPATFVLLPLAAAATIALAVAPLWLRTAATSATPPWAVVEVEGAASIASHTVNERSTLSAGQSLRTGPRGHVVLALGPVGHVEIAPGSEVTLLPAATGRYLFHLDRGAVTALIWADPGRFFIDTHSSRAVDLGCAYTLRVDARGEGELHVTTGWVGFQMRDRQALIPAGAMCRTHAHGGPGTPYFEDAPAALRSAVDTIDGDADVAMRAAALDSALAAARPRDALTLWHLLQRVDAEERGRVYDRLAAIVPPPAGVTRDGVRAGDRRMLELWWDSLGLGDTEWWHLMSRPWTEPSSR